MTQTAKKIKKLREYQDISQSYMADKLDISQPAYALMEAGKTNISEKRLKKIASILDIEVEKLISNEQFSLSIQNNTLNDNASVIKELHNSQNELYERLLEEKDTRIKFLEKQLDSLKK